MTPPNCPGGSTNFTDNINDYLPFFNHLCSYIMKTLHTHLCLTGSKSQHLLGTGFKAMQIFKSAFLFKESPPLQDKIQFQNCSDQQLHGARCTTIFRKLPTVSDHSYLPAPSCSCVHNVYYTIMASFVFWPREKICTVD